MSMPSRHQLLFASAAISSFLFATTVQAATPSAQPAKDTQPAAKTSATHNSSADTPTTAPIAGILDGSNGETINVHGRHAADGTGAKYMNKIVYLGPLGNRDTLDTPYSVMGVPHDVVVNQQLRNINDMAQYLPSVQLEIRGDPNTSRPQSRGFEADVVANSRLDGLNVVSTTPYPAEWVDNLQVLNGLAGAMYGPQNPAGVFEYTLKRPTDRRTERLSVGVDSIGTPTVNGDISGRIGKKGWFGYRLNMLHADGTAYTENSWIRREMVSADFDIHLDDKTVIELDASHYTYAERGTAPAFGINASTQVSQIPTAPDLSNSIGAPWSGFNMETNTFLAKIKHQFNKNWSITLGGLYQDAIRSSFPSSNTIINNNGKYTETPSAAKTANDFRVGSNMAYLNGRVHTGPLTHDLVIGTNGYMMGNYNPTSWTTYSGASGGGYLDGAHDHVGSQPYFSGRFKSASITSQSLIVGDTIKINKHWSVMGTLSWSWINQESRKTSAPKGANYTIPGAFVSSSVSAAFSPTASVMYKPTENQTIYFTYADSVQAGPSSNASAANPYTTLPIAHSQEYEVGYKIRYGKMQFNVAGFRMTSPYAASICATKACSGASGSLLYAYAGTQRNYGVEAQISGEILPNLSVLAGMTWLDAELLNSNVTAAVPGTNGTKTVSANGKEIVGVAPLQANLLLDYRLPSSLGAFASGWAFNANVHYMGNRAADMTNTLHTGSYTTLDLGTRYAFHVHHFPWVVRFGVSNATNERYWASVYTGSPGATSGSAESLYAGLPRIYHFTFSAEF